jgi:hypothetical protein
MPLVLTENEATESGITYEDRTGVSYQYPIMYRRAVQPGERFIYYRGRGRKDGRRGPQVYFGTGVIGDIVSNPAIPGRLICRILDYRAFATPIPFKSAPDGYLELAGKRRGYFQRGVRTITPKEFSSILSAANALADATNPNFVSAAVAKVVTGPRYASPEKLREIEDFAIASALEEIQRRYPGVESQVLPRNNPGFDIQLTFPDGPVYVEVKGTERPTPVFFATEGELQFSRRKADRYRLVVVHAIDLEARTYIVAWREGCIASETGFLLRPVQWACELTAPLPIVDASTLS